MADTKISALTTDTAPDRTADYLPTYDASAGATKKVLLSNVGPTILTAEVWNCAPADSQTYYFGIFPSNTLTTTAASRVLYIDRPGRITRARVAWNATSGGAETSSLYIRLNNTSDTTVSTAWAINGNGSLAAVTGLAVDVVAGDYIEMKWTTPAWGTNPTAVYVRVNLLFE